MLLFNQQYVRFCCVIAALLLLSQSLRAEVVVVTGAKRSTIALSKKQICDLFLGKVASFPDGRNAAPIDQPESNPLREEFYSRVANKSAAQVKAGWAKLFFTGRGELPREGTSSDDIKRLLNSIPGGIGYIERSSLDSSVKMIQIVQTAKINDIKGADFGD